MTETLLRRADVEQRTGFSRSTIYRLMSDGEFPRPLRIGRQAVRWRASDIDTWIASKPISDISQIA